MTLTDVYVNAKEHTTTCKVCPICNGLACRGQIPGVGGKGWGNTFVRNYQKLHEVLLNLDTICADSIIDTTSDFFNHSVSMPVYAAPIAGMKAQYGSDVTEYEFAQALVVGSNEFGTFSFLGDSVDINVFKTIAAVSEEGNGLAIPTMKPWEKSGVDERLNLLAETNTIALACDVDAAGLVFLRNTNPRITNFSIDDIKYVKKNWQKPFIIKGIMTVEGAMKALEGKADGIVVSNHGGRVLDDGLATIEVLRDIVVAVNHQMKIFVDGGFRSGVDVFKALALGADGVLIGRPLALAAIGGKEIGVKLYLEKIQQELVETMMMTGCKNISDITIDKVVVK